MNFRLFRVFLFSAALLFPLFSISAQKAAKACFTPETRAQAERSAHVWMEPGGYDPVLGYDPSAGPRRGAPPIDENGRALPIRCFANRDTTPGSGTTPKFHCSVAGVT